MADTNTPHRALQPREGRSGGGRGFSDKAIIKHLIDPFLDAAEFGWRQGAVLVIRSLSAGCNLDLVIPGSMGGKLIGILGEEVVDMVAKLFGKSLVDVVPC